MSQVSVSEASRNLSHWVNRASFGREFVVVTSRGKPKAVIIGIETLEELIGIEKSIGDDLIPLEALRREFREALVESGYTERDDIVQLVREVKEEYLAEQGVGTEGSDD